MSFRLHWNRTAPRRSRVREFLVERGRPILQAQHWNTIAMKMRSILADTRRDAASQATA